MVGVARKVQVSPSEVNATENGGERNELITVMEEMEVREEEMAEGDELVEEDCAKAEGGGAREVHVGTGRHRDLNSGGAARRNNDSLMPVMDSVS